MNYQVSTELSRDRQFLVITMTVRIDSIVQGVMGLNSMPSQREAEQIAMMTLLTPKEREVFDLMVRGKASKEVAGELRMSVRTVKFHRGNILRKFGVSDYAALLTLGRFNAVGKEIHEKHKNGDSGPIGNVAGQLSAGSGRRTEH